MVGTRTCVAVVTFAGICYSVGTSPRTRNFDFEYKAVVKDVPPGAKRVDLWVPVPHDDPYQRITDLRIQSPYSYKIVVGADGNTMLHVAVDNPADSEIAITMSLDSERREHTQARLEAASKPFKDEDPNSLAQYLKPDRLVPLDDQIRTWARQVVEAAHAHTDLEMARAIYNHVVATVKYDKSGKGWGRGDIYYACSERRGNCTDFHAIFIGYCRALGIPARFAIGFPLPADRGQGKVAGYHCWAEFYAKGIGWVPIDASEAAKNPDKREYFFGHHDENRIEFSKGRDIVLTPKQQGEPLNYFVYPYAEVDGKPFTDTELAVTYRDIGAR